MHTNACTLIVNPFPQMSVPCCIFFPLTHSWTHKLFYDLFYLLVKSHTIALNPKTIILLFYAFDCSLHLMQYVSDAHICKHSLAGNSAHQSAYCDSLNFFPPIWESEGPINCFTQDLYFPSIHFLSPLQASGASKCITIP